MANGRVNWGKGRMQMFESIAAFTARFCILNGISIAEARKFFEDEFGCQWPPRDVDMTLIGKLATVLDESVPVIENLLYLYAKYKDGDYFDIERGEHVELRYCEVCLNSGYHSVFHELCFLKKCPFHGELIKSVNSESPQRGYTHYLYLLHRTLSLTGSWRRFEGRTDLITDANYGRVVGVLHWLHSTLDVSYRYKENIIWHFSLVAGPDRPSTKYAKMQFLNPPTVQVSEFCTPVARPVKQLESKFSLAILDTLDNCSIRMGELVWFFNQTLLLSGQTIQDRFPTIEEHGVGREAKSDCKCCWGRTRYQAWRSTYPGEWPMGYLACPVNVARNELLQDWGSAFGKRSGNDWFRYVQYAETLEKIGLVESLRKAESTIQGTPGKPIVRWIANPEFTRLIETTLDECFSMQMRELVLWLNGIEGGASPEPRPRTEESMDLLRDDDGVRLVTWIREPTH